MNSPVEKIKERLSIVDVVSSYIQVIKAGKNYKAKCPFHNEKTPSFFIAPERESYYCFGCGAKGDIFTFVEQFEGLDFKGALKLLADKAGVVLTYERNEQSLDQKEKFYQILEEATKYFEVNLENNIQAKEYLKDRGIQEETIKNFRIGYASEEWRLILDYLTRKNFKKEDIEKVGLIKNSGSNYYDRFRGRIIFPICDSSGRTIAFTGRIFSQNILEKNDNQEVAKYLNSPETPLFNKSGILFGIDKAKNSIRMRNYSILVEGQMDLVLSHQAGFTNTVAISGTALAEKVEKTDKDELENNVTLQKVNNLGLIRRLSDNIILAFDGDQAGIKASGRSAMIALSLGMQVKIAILPEGQDPADIILLNKEQWKDIIKNSVNIIDFYLDRICNETNDTRKIGQKIREIIFPFLNVLNSRIERASYISLINQKTNIPIEAISQDLAKYINENQGIREIEVKEKEQTKHNAKNRKKELEKNYLGIIYWHKKQIDVHPEILNIDNEFKERIGPGLFEDLNNLYQDISEDLAFKAEMWYGGEIEKTIPDLKELTLNLEEEILNEKIFNLREKINYKNKEVNQEELSKILIDFQKTVGRIEEIKYLRGQ
jgi:DNA primase